MKMNKLFNLFFAFALVDITFTSGAQVGIGTNSPNISAQLDVNSTTKGFLPPRMTSTQRDAITSPSDGLIIYNTTNNRLEIRSASSWLTLVTLSGTETLTNKTLTTPVLSTSSDASIPPAGTIRYSSGSGGVLQYSNAASWNTLTSTVQKSIVIGYFSSYSGTGLQVLGCTETQDRNNDFQNNTFTAPRTGLYLVTANILTSFRSWSIGEELNIGAYQAGTTIPYFLGLYFSQAAINTYGGATSSCVISLTQSQQVNFQAFNYDGFTVYLPEYNQFSITEL